MTRPLLATVAAALLAAAVSSVLAAGPGSLDEQPLASGDELASATAAPLGLVGATPAPTGIATDALRARRPAPVEPVARTEPPAEPPLPTSTSPEGWTVAGAAGADPVGVDGRLVRWTLEVEPATGLDVREVLATAEAALHDPRSWTRTHRLQRVEDPATADVRVLVARPPTVDELCARAGLDTNGIFSCWNGRVAAINLRRWLEATPEFPDLATYRAYVVNHEVGHGLGRGHVGCAGTGRTADVMQQQTRTLAGCVANPWPYPDAG